MRRNHIYRTVSVEAFDRAALHCEVPPGQQVVVAIDVAKTKFVAAFSDRTGAWHSSSPTACAR